MDGCYSFDRQLGALIFGSEVDFGIDWHNQRAPWSEEGKVGRVVSSGESMKTRVEQKDNNPSHAIKTHTSVHSINLSSPTINTSQTKQSELFYIDTTYEDSTLASRWPKNEYSSIILTRLTEVTCLTSSSPSNILLSFLVRSFILIR